MSLSTIDIDANRLELVKVLRAAEQEANTLSLAVVSGDVAARDRLAELNATIAQCRSDAAVFDRAYAAAEANEESEAKQEDEARREKRLQQAIAAFEDMVEVGVTIERTVRLLSKATGEFDDRSAEFRRHLVGSGYEDSVFNVWMSRPGDRVFAFVQGFLGGEHIEGTLKDHLGNALEEFRSRVDEQKRLRSERGEDVE